MGNTKKINIQKLILLSIIVLAFFLRFYKLGKAPPSLNWDEAALGYNAYSLLKTGRDEYGIRFPSSLRSFGDYKPPLYTYLTIPSIAIFGLNEFAVRFPSAFFGVLTVLLTYFLVNELFINGLKRNSKLVNPLTRNKSIALASIFLLAISPWHIQFSRGAFEANLGLFLVVLGTYLFLKGLKKKFLLSLSAVIFSLCLYAYHSSRVFAPLLALSLAFLYKKELLKLRKRAIISFLIGIILIIPFVKTLIQGDILARFSGVSVFTDPSLLTRSIRKIEEDQNNLLARIIHNRRIVYASVFLENYLSHFEPNFLFIEADKNPRHHAPANGLLYFWEIITIPIGFYLLSCFKGKGKWVILSFLFLSPIASAPAQASPHAIRSLNSVPVWVIISGFGLAFLFKKAKRLRFLMALLILFNFFYWFNLYFIHMPLETSQAWQHGYKEVVNEVSRIEKSYDKVMITGQYDQPYIFFLFYKKYDPQKYQDEYGNPEELPRYERSFSKHQFLKEINLDKIEKDSKILIVATNEEVGGRGDFKTIKKIDFLDGSPAFLIGEKI